MFSASARLPYHAGVPPTASGGLVASAKNDTETCIVLAGGRGTRLHGETGGGNKHLLPVAGVPALAHVLGPLAQSYTPQCGIVVTNPASVADVRTLLDTLGLSAWRIVEQPEPDGTLSAIRCALPLVDTPSFSVHLGDNLFAWRAVPPAGADYEAGAAMEIFTRAIPTREAARFAVVTVANGAVQQVHEKPDLAASGDTVLALTGFARFNTAHVHEHAAAVPRSQRNEFEVTSLIDRYLSHGLLVAARDLEVAWLDYGTPESLREAENILRAREETP